MRGYACIGLEKPKKLTNIGSVLRAAYVYNVAMVAISGMRYKHAPTDTPKASRHLPLLHVKNLKDVIPYDCISIAVDLIENAIPLQNYIHPEQAFYIFGPENGTLKEISWCRDIIYIPTRRCMNLAATVNVVLYDRMAKQPRR